MADGGKISMRLLIAVAVMQRLVDTHPMDPPYRVDLADADQAFGRMLAQLGRAREALEIDQKALAIQQGLFHQDPTNLSYRRAVVIGSLLVAGFEASGGDYAAALVRSRVALGSAEALAALDPSNTADRRDLWRSEERRVGKERRSRWSP